MLSINVTCLTKARLFNVLEFAHTNSIHVIGLQETKHRDLNVKWAKRLAARFGFSFTFSAVPHAQGGTALGWLRTMGKVHITNSDTHRQVSAQWKHFVFSSVYGPADSRPDPAWVTSVTTPVSQSNTPKVEFILGDFNWKPCYNTIIPPRLIVSPPIITTSGGTEITKCLFSAEGIFKSQYSLPIAGIPYHHAVVYSFCGIPVPVSPQAFREKRCASYEWNDLDVIIDNNHEILTHVNAALPCVESASLSDRWSLWHRRAELTYKLSADLGLATCVRKAERGKGSYPSVRPVNCVAAHRPDEPLLARRLKRVHRGLAHRVRHGSTLIHQCTLDDKRRWESCVADGHLPPILCIDSIDSACVIINSHLKTIEQAHSSWKSAQWRKNFSDFSNNTWKSAKHIMNPEKYSNQLSADDLADVGKELWSPEDKSTFPDTARAWHQFNDSNSGVAPNHGEWPSHLKRSDPRFEMTEHGILPTQFQIRDRLAAVSGGSGFDGWTSHEISNIARRIVFLADELSDIIISTITNIDSVSQDLCDDIWRIKAIGIVKGDDFDCRLLGIYSVIVRAWHSSYLPIMPQPVPEQWSGKRNVSVSLATCEWLSAKLRAGAEVDQSKAFDRITHEAATASLIQGGLPPIITRCLDKAWKAPRICAANGEHARAIRPTRSIPQGDPTAPSTFGSVTSPWGKQLPSNHTTAWVDDRSIGELVTDTSAVGEALSAGIDTTTAFDSALGLVENVKKRQIWYAGDCTPIEHLGLRVVYDDPSVPIVPRDQFEKLHSLIHNLRQIPGPSSTRERLAHAYIMPLTTWAGPLMSKVPNVSLTIMKNCTRTQCTWWCSARWFADRISIHLVLGTAIRNLDSCDMYFVHFNEHLKNAIDYNAKTLDLSADWSKSSGCQALWLTPTQACDRRVVTIIAALGYPDGSFLASSCKGKHILRVAGRAKVISKYSKSRHDIDGILDVDLNACSHGMWKKFTRQLDPVDRTHLSNFRGGASRNPVRGLKSVRAMVATGEFQCPYCQAINPSFRHYIESCTGPGGSLDLRRSQLSSEANIDPQWWTSLPIVSSKSGWICLSASSSPCRRVEMQIALCKLAISIHQVMSRILADASAANPGMMRKG